MDQQKEGLTAEQVFDELVSSIEDQVVLSFPTYLEADKFKRYLSVYKHRNKENLEEVFGESTLHYEIVEHGSEVLLRIRINFGSRQKRFAGKIMRFGAKH